MSYADFIEDFDGRFWRRDAFHSYERDGKHCVIAYRDDRDGFERSARFDKDEFEERLLPAIFPAFPGHFAILNGRSDDDQWQPRLLSVFGWVHGECGLCPMTEEYDTVFRPWPILLPDGSVEDGNRYESLEAYTAYRRERAKRSKAQ